jgi:beta-lactamase class A
MKFKPQICFALLLALALGGVLPVVGQDSPGATPKESPGRVEVEKLIQKNGADVAVAFRSLDGTQDFFIQADKQFPAASAIMKIPVMVELYAEAQAGELRLTDSLPVHNGFHSMVDGSLYHLDPKGDSDPEVYRAIGKTLTLRELCEEMIARDSNLAANLLVEKLGIDRIRQRMHLLRADGVEFHRGFEGTAKDDGPNNTTSARGLMELLWALAKDEAVSREASQEMTGIVARSTSHEAAVAPPPNTSAARTAVRISGIHHEATIVYGPHSFVLVILAGNITNPDASSALIAQITHALAAGIW